MQDNLPVGLLLKLEELESIQQQFDLSWTSGDSDQTNFFLNLLSQYEQILQYVISEFNLLEVNDNTKQRLASNLQWLNAQIDLVSNEKSRLAEQILQLSRAKKGYGS